MRFLLLSLSLLAFHHCGEALARPGQVLIIRHGEKINDDDPHLSPRGKQRAQKLVRFFQKDESVTEYGPPVAIYAAAPKRQGGSLRSIETVTPLAEAMRLKVIEDYTADDFKKLAKEILEERAYDGKTVLVSWAHDEIPKVAKYLGVHPKPDDWEKGAFDRVWKITFRKDGEAKLKDLPQDLLPGDSR